MKKYVKFIGCLLILGVILPFSSCKDDDEPEKEKRPDNEIVEFSVPSLDLTGVVDAATKTVTINVSSEYDMDKLKDVVPSIKISTSATISPEATAKQDFSKDVKYTVTAENGTAKEWTVTVVKSKYVSSGIGKTSELWVKDGTTLGLSVNNEATIATFGDKIVVSRTGLIFDAKTGESKGQLNMDGIVVNPDNAATNVAFTLANDDAGNLIGCVLGAWSTPKFKVYKWTALDAAPVEIISFEKEGTSFGRKLVAIGDVNGTAYVTSYDVNSSKTTALHYCWKFTGGIAGEAVPVGSGSATGDNFQMLLPVSTTNLNEYYISCRGEYRASPPTFLNHVTLSGTTEIKGPLTVETGDVPEIKQGWGRKILHSLLFNFNGKQYLAVLSYGDMNNIVDYHYFIFDVKDNHKKIFQQKVSYPGVFGTINFNGTAGLAVSKAVEDDGTKKINLYGLMTTSGIVCFELTNLAQ